MFSPANTSPALTELRRQGPVLPGRPARQPAGRRDRAELVLEDGNASAYILNLDDAYGNGIAEVVADVLTASGVEVLGVKAYDPTAAAFDTEVGEVVAADPDAVVADLVRRGQPRSCAPWSNRASARREELLRHRRQHGQRARRELRRRNLIRISRHERGTSPRGPGALRVARSAASAAGGLGQGAEVELDHFGSASRSRPVPV